MPGTSYGHGITTASNAGWSSEVQELPDLEGKGRSFVKLSEAVLLNLNFYDEKKIYTVYCNI